MTDQALDRIRRLLLGLALLVIVVLLLRELADVALLVFAAILIADVLHGGAERLGRGLRLPTGAALLLILVAGIGTLGCAIWFRGPVISTEVVGLAGQVSVEAGRLRQALADAPWAQHAIARVQAYLAGGHVAGMVSGIATGTLGVLGSFVVMVAAALYFAASPGLYVRGALMLLPIDRRPPRPRDPARPRPYAALVVRRSVGGHAGGRDADDDRARAARHPARVHARPDRGRCSISCPISARSPAPCRRCWSASVSDRARRSRLRSCSSWCSRWKAT